MNESEFANGGRHRVDPREGTQLRQYRIDQRVGAGGMGVVYKAEDTRLRRTVALKFLNNAASGSAEHRLRFLREARAAAALHHPNICPVYEIVETDEFTALAHYWVNGPPLHVWAERFGGAVPVSKALDVAAQILMGLDAAHRKGVVHRDIKPGNILMDAGDEVRIVDFGLAHISSENNLTAVGMVMGTPAYMAPEQWVGGESDARTDVWAVGVVLYELLTGRRPFEAKEGRVLSHLILQEPPEPVGAAREVPDEVEALIEAALAKSPEERFPTAAAMLAAVRSAAEGLVVKADSETVTMAAAASPGGVAPAPASRTPRSKTGPPSSRFGQPGSRVTTEAAAAPASGSLPPPEAGVSGISRRQPLIWMAAGAAAVSAGTYYISSRKSPPPPPAAAGARSLAVLPFRDLSPNSEYLGDGLTDEIISTLSKVRTLRVIARTSSFQFRGEKANTQEIARQLNVDRVLTGSLQRTGNQVRLSVQLVNAEDGTVLWGDTFVRASSDLFALPAQIAAAVLPRLAVRPDQAGPAARSFATNPDAYNHYLQGLYQWNQRSPVSLEAALASFRRSLELDSGYALAWSGLADTQVLRALFGLVSPHTAMKEAKEAARRALALDKDLAEAHNSSGLIRLLYEWDRAGAEADLRRALQLNPGYATGHHWFGHFLAWSARFTESFAELAMAQDLDPLSLAIRTNIGWLKGLARDFEQGITQLRLALAMDSRFVRAHLYLATLLGQSGKFDEAFGEMRAVRQLSGESATVVATEAWLLAKSGNRAAALEAKGKLLAWNEKTYVTPPEMVMVCVVLQQRDEALRWLRRAIEDRAPTLIWAGLDFRLDQSRQDPAFLEVLRQVGS